jgi:uncharacterized protein (TIGR03067 family)
MFVKTALALCVTSTLLVAPARCSDDDKDDAKAIEGTWLPTEAELAGEKFSDEVLKSIKLVLKGDEYTATVGENADKGTFTIDPAKDPKALDIKGTDGPNKGKTFLCIYKLEKDTLKVCYDLSGKNRPTEFKTKSDTQLYLAVYKRDKS